MSPPFAIRLAAAADADIIGWHRARMFQDMGMVPDAVFESFRAKSIDRLRATLADGEYIGWLASETEASAQIIAGAGVLLRNVPPFPLSQHNGKVRIAEGRQGLIVNVFTEPAWRRRGIGRALMQQIIAWSRDRCLDNLVLHASADGRELYEELGFIPTNEMRLVPIDNL